MAAMLKVFRYVLATTCFAMSIGLLSLWGWTVTHRNQLIRLSYIPQAGYSTSGALFTGVNSGEAFLSAPQNSVHWSDGSWLRCQSAIVTEEWRQSFASGHSQGLFGVRKDSVYFPIWYPALIFAIAGASALKINGRFTLRSAIIAVSVMAGLLGMSVGL